MHFYYDSFPKGNSKIIGHIRMLYLTNTCPVSMVLFSLKGLMTLKYSTVAVLLNSSGWVTQKSISRCNYKHEYGRQHNWKIKISIPHHVRTFHFCFENRSQPPQNSALSGWQRKSTEKWKFSSKKFKHIFYKIVFTNSRL